MSKRAWPRRILEATVFMLLQVTMPRWVIPYLWGVIVVGAIAEFIYVPFLHVRVKMAYANWGNQQRMVFFSRSIVVIVLTVVLAWLGVVNVFKLIYPPPDLTFEAFFFARQYTGGTRMNGIYWQRAYVPVELHIRNRSDRPISNLDLKVSVSDKLYIAAVGEFQNLSECKFVEAMPMEISHPPTARSSTGEVLTLTYPDEKDMPHLRHAYFVRCSRVVKERTLVIVLAVMDAADDFSLEFPLRDLTQEVPPPTHRRAPQYITVQGTIEDEGQQRHPINMSVSVARGKD